MGDSPGLDPPSIRLLGPVELSDAAALAPRERALLARLALDVGRTVTHDRLVDDLWQDRPPPTARNALRVYVSHLRARLGRTAVVSMGGGYRLEVAPEQVDAQVFERLVAVAMGYGASGRPADAVGSLDLAAALWRGGPLADLADYEFARVEAARLTDLRATALEHLADALLATGQLDRLADEFGPLLRDFPFRDRLRAAVMTGLYHQGRAVDALALYSEAVDLLREELGLEPGPTLKALQVRILNDDPALAASLPAGELTLLATALDAPAAVESALGEAYGDALLVQRDLLRTAFSAHAGLALPTDGQRMLAAFPAALNAVRAATAAHRALAHHPFADGAVLRVRIGVHTGIPRVVEQHYVGLEVHRVAQVALAAAGGQTLATGSTIDRLDPAVLAEDGLVVTDLGSHRLPEVTQLELLHQISAPGERFPPPQSLGGRTRLPRSTVPLVGRDDDVRALVEAAGRPGRGVTTLLGPGGTGKTRLAIEVAARLGATSAGGVYFVPLETATSSIEVWAGLGAALDLPPDARNETSVVAHLDQRRTFLVLDSLEQVPDVGAALERLLECNGDVRVLATSRTPTDVSGERLHPLEPLSDTPASATASTLFAAFAALARPGFVLDEGNCDAVARICRRVDGLPLGIELAAARVRQLPPDILAERLQSSLDLVTGGPSRPGRQRSLGALAGWSFDLLEDHQRRLLGLLSLFVGGVDLDTVARFPSGEGHDPVTTTLALADASLVRISDDAVARVTLLATIRTFATEMLMASGHDVAAREVHLGVMRDVARRSDERVSGSDRPRQVVARERLNFEGAVDWALEADPPRAEEAAEIVISLGAAWHQLGERAFDRTRRVSLACPPGSPHRPWLAYWDYRCTWDTEVEGGVILAALQDTEAQLRTGPDRAALAAFLAYGTGLGIDVGLVHEWGVERATEAVKIAREIGGDWLLSICLDGLVTAYIEAGREAEAGAALPEARAAAARHGAVERLDHLTLVDAVLMAAEGRTNAAWETARAAATSLVSRKSDGTLFFTCWQLARLAAPDQPSAAATLSGISLASIRRMGSMPSPADITRIRSSVASAVASLGDASFDRLQNEAEQWSADDAVAWVLDLLVETSSTTDAMITLPGLPRGSVVTHGPP